MDIARTGIGCIACGTWRAWPDRIRLARSVLLGQICMAEKRHLNVIAAAAPDEEAMPSRSRLRWIVVGGLSVVVTWLPLAMLGLWLSRALTQGVNWANSSAWLRQLCGLLPIVGSFALAATLGGLLVVRFGPAARGGANALLTGGLSGALVTSLAAVGGVLRPWPLGAAAYISLMLVGAAAAAGGGWQGRRLRNAATLTSLSQAKSVQATH